MKKPMFDNPTKSSHKADNIDH